MALEHIFALVFGIPCTHYFDDLTFIGPDNIMPSLMEIAKDALAFLGWKVKGEDKDKPLADEFKALGVLFDLKEMSNLAPILRVVNTASRVENIVSSIEEILSSGDITTQQASRLAGKLVFARSQVFGRVGSLALRILYKPTHLATKAGLDAETKWALWWWKRTLPTAEPRIVHLAGHRQPLVIFSDG